MHAGSHGYEYDAIGQLTKRIEPDGTAISYTYDATHNRASVTVPSGTTTFTYDDANRLRAVTEPGGGETNYTYDVIGNLLRTTYPNHTRTERSYDSLDRIVRLENRRPDASIMSGFTYALGPIGNRLSVTEDGGRSTTYSVPTACTDSRRSARPKLASRIARLPTPTIEMAIAPRRSIRRPA